MNLCVLSSLAVEISPTVTAAANVSPIKTPLKMQQQQQESANKMYVYKCNCCTFKSKDLGHAQYVRYIILVSSCYLYLHFRYHVYTHQMKNGPEENIPYQAAAKTLTTVRIRKNMLFYL